jgi:hypothetical protein
MQAMVMQDVNRVDISLDPEHVYEQVIARSAGQHGVLDLLTVTKSKRLAILEFKAAENPELPLQAADFILPAILLFIPRSMKGRRMSATKTNVTKPKATWRDMATSRVCSSRTRRPSSIWWHQRSAFTPRPRLS